MIADLRAATSLLALLTVLTGVVYPLAVTIIAQTICRSQANGSVLSINGQVVGSRLIGQAFSAPRHFWGRPSATAPYPYNAAASAGSNLGPINPALADAVRTRVEALRAADPTATAAVPVDLVTASGSGLDPHISIAAARYQVARVARARAMPIPAVDALIERYTEGRQWGFLGEPRVNVLLLNHALDLANPG